MMTADEYLAAAIRKTLWLRSQYVDQIHRDLQSIKELDAHLHRAGYYPEFREALQAGDPAVFGLEVRP